MHLVKTSVFLFVLAAGVLGTPERAAAQPAASSAMFCGLFFARDDLNALPHGHNVGSLLDTAAAIGVAHRIDAGGLTTGEPVLIGSHGSSWTQATYSLGGVDITDRFRGGVPLLYPDLTAIDEVTLLSALLPIDIDAPGPHVALEPRAPSPAWRGSVAAQLTPGSAMSASTYSPVAQLTHWSRGELALSGPLVRDRLGLALSASHAASRRVERGTPQVLKGAAGSVFAHLQYTPSARDEGSLVVSAQRTSRPFEARPLAGARDALERDSFFSAQGRWSRRFASGAVGVLRTGYQVGRFSPKTDAAAVSESIERLEWGPVPELVLRSAGGRRTRWTADAVFTPRPMDTGGWKHDVQLGATVSGAGAVTDRLQVNAIPELVAGHAARVWEYRYGGSPSRWRQSAVAAYAGDRISRSDLVVELGARVDRSDGSAAGASTPIRWRSWSPRASARWMPLGDRFALLGGYRLYHYQMPLSHLAYGDPNAPFARVFRWTDDNGDRAFQPSEQGALVALVGPGEGGGLSSIDPDLKAPHVHEWLAGVEVPFGAWHLRFSGLARNEQQLVANVNVGVPIAAYDVSYLPDPALDLAKPHDDQFLPVYNRRPGSFGQDRYLLTNRDAPRAAYRGLELTLDRRGDRWRWLFGATAEMTNGPRANRGFQAVENDQGVIGEVFTNPNAETSARGRLFFERGYIIKTSGSLRAGHGVVAGFSARYQDGQHFARMVIAPDLNQGAEAIQALPNGRVRFTYTLTLDARVEKQFDAGPGQAALIAEAFNLLNTRNEVEEEVISGPDFRTATVRQPPRVMRVGIRWGW